MRDVVTTDQAPAAIGPYSQAIAANGLLFCSGQIALDPTTGKMIEGGVQPETERVLQNVKALLAARKLGFEHVVKTTVFLATMDDFKAMNEVYAKYFTASPPARSTVAAAGLPRNARVEIECVAAFPTL